MQNVSISTYWVVYSCLELITKKDKKWTLTYVKPSKVETDVPESAAELRVQCHTIILHMVLTGQYVVDANTGHCDRWKCHHHLLGPLMATMVATFADCNKCKAAHMTTAAPMIFKLITIGQAGMTEEFIVGGLGTNNQIEQVLNQV
ncbi:hypothetical protein L208DRAFT_1374027 [Tricholoma matsutake]|nr:hypothetical protein L208DRAFT_1374027 [Tricholoma matsutake 945]